MATIILITFFTFSVYLQGVRQSGLCNSLNESKFYINRDFENNKPQATRNVSETTCAARSKLHCASLCSARYDECAYFKFDKNTQICYMFSSTGTGKEIILSDVFTVRDHCKNTGYKKLTFVSDDMCIKCYKDFMPLGNATVHCSKFQAQLPKLDTKRKQEAIQREQAQLGMESAFIGGHYDGGKWVWFDGQSVIAGGAWATVTAAMPQIGMRLTLSEVGFQGTSDNDVLPFCCEEL